MCPIFAGRLTDCRESYNITLTVTFASFTASVLLDITYGHIIQSGDDEYLTFAEQADEALQVATRASVIDLFPIC